MLRWSAGWAVVLPISGVFGQSLSVNIQNNRREKAVVDPYLDVYAPYGSRPLEIFEGNPWPAARTAFAGTPLQVQPEYHRSRGVQWHSPTDTISSGLVPHKLVNVPSYQAGVRAVDNARQIISDTSRLSVEPTTLPVTPAGAPSLLAKQPETLPPRGPSTTPLQWTQVRSPILIDASKLAPATPQSEPAPRLDAGFLDFVSDWEGKDHLNSTAPKERSQNTIAISTPEKDIKNNATRNHGHIYPRESSLAGSALAEISGTLLQKQISSQSATVILESSSMTTTSPDSSTGRHVTDLTPANDQHVIQSSEKVGTQPRMEYALSCCRGRRSM